MGDHFQVIVDLDATATDAAELGDRARDWLVRDPDWEPLGGLNIETGRTVFLGGQGDAQYAICPQCAARTHFCDSSPG